jgi:ribosomal protein S18 acetylase RimI-like enzyme
VNRVNTVEIGPITEAHIESFHKTLDVVARERRYLAFLEAPPLESTRAFILNNIAHGYPQFVATVAGEVSADEVLGRQALGCEVVGWCDVTPKSRPIYAHCGVLGMGLLPRFRGQGLGTRLITRTLHAARAFGLSRVELSVREDNTNAIALYEKIGFVTEGLQRNGVLVDGEYENIIEMAILL